MGRAVAMVAAAVLLTGCSPEIPPSAAPARPGSQDSQPASVPARLATPVTMEVRQRSTTPVGGSDGDLLLTIDDVTSNQVMTSLARKDGTVVLAPSSLAPGGSRVFQYRGASYVLTLAKLKNKLIGQDFATFTISEKKPDLKPSLSEDEKIERLLKVVGELQKVAFVRNGAEHTPQAAADHLRSKWKSKADQIKTATQFIDLVATKSSMSGEPYRMKLTDGRVVDVAAWLKERLAEIERQP